MALILEEKIMEEIGLGNNYRFFEGAYCLDRRRGISEKIASAIQKHYDAGEQIAQPDKELIALLNKVSEKGDSSQYSLMNTWKAASEVIATHIYAFGVMEKDKIKSYVSLRKHIIKTYLPLNNLPLKELVNDSRFTKYEFNK